MPGFLHEAKLNDKEGKCRLALENRLHPAWPIVSALGFGCVKLYKLAKYRKYNSPAWGQNSYPRDDFTRSNFF
jgi:hypothetical protein